MAEIKAIIFDLDGVLVDAKDWHFEALNMAIGLFGMEISRYDHLVTYDGLPTRKKLEMLSREHGLPGSLHGFINQIKQQYTIDYIQTRCKPVFCHQYALSKFKESGIRLAVASNSVRNTVKTILEKSGLLDYFEFFLSNEDVFLPKPNPEIYHKAMERLGFEPEECLIVEDNEKGIQAAHASGGRVLEVIDVQDVNYENIMNKINDEERKISC